MLIKEVFIVKCIVIVIMVIVYRRFLKGNIDVFGRNLKVYWVEI